MSNARDKQDQQRQQRNEELVRRMKAGENLSSFTNQSSWFPPRPSIKKDASEIKRLYGESFVSPHNRGNQVAATEDDSCRDDPKTVADTPSPSDSPSKVKFLKIANRT